VVLSNSSRGGIDLLLELRLNTLWAIEVKDRSAVRSRAGGLYRLRRRQRGLPSGALSGIGTLPSDAKTEVVPYAVLMRAGDLDALS
jgi:hypothetical protein